MDPKSAEGKRMSDEVHHRASRPARGTYEDPAHESICVPHSGLRQNRYDGKGHHLQSGDHPEGIEKAPTQTEIPKKMMEEMGKDDRGRDA